MKDFDDMTEQEFEDLPERRKRAFSDELLNKMGHRLPREHYGYMQKITAQTTEQLTAYAAQSGVHPTAVLGLFIYGMLHGNLQKHTPDFFRRFWNQIVNNLANEGITRDRNEALSERKGANDGSSTTH